MSPLVIDASAFPEIMDSIVNYAEPEALRVLRATSHDIRRRVDRRIARHIIFERDTLKTAYGPIPPLWNWNEVEKSVTALDTVDLVDVLDDDSEFPSEFSAVLFQCERFPNLKLLRQKGSVKPGTPRIPASTTAHFLPIARRNGGVEMSVPHAVGARKLVVNLLDHEKPPARFHRMYVELEDIVEVVVTFSILHSPTTYNGMLEYLARTACQWCNDSGRSPASVTMVDLDGIQPPGRLRADFIAYLSTQYHRTWDLFGDGWTPPSNEWLAEQVTFLTFGEYSARVGKDIAVLETDQFAVA